MQDDANAIILHLASVLLEGIVPRGILAPLVVSACPCLGDTS